MLPPELIKNPNREHKIKNPYSGYEPEYKKLNIEPVILDTASYPLPKVSKFQPIKPNFTVNANEMIQEEEIVEINSESNNQNTNISLLDSQVNEFSLFIRDNFYGNFKSKAQLEDFLDQILLSENKEFDNVDIKDLKIYKRMEIYAGITIVGA